jgi:hypothetical protein
MLQKCTFILLFTGDNMIKTTIGIIAGNGELPLLISREAKKSGKRVAICAIKGEADPVLEEIAEAFEWGRLGELGKVVKFFRAENVKDVVMAGKIRKTNLFKGEVRPDFDMLQVLAKTLNHSDDSLLGGIANFLESKDIRLVDTTTLLTKDSLPDTGVLTKRKPSKQEALDIEYGWMLAKEMGRLDVGQTVVVKKQAVLAIEAIEGTDEAIRRGGVLGNGDVVVIKTAKPNQDMRFDVPTVGLGTLEAMIESQAVVLAIEAGKTIVLNKEELVKKADQNRITIVCR